MHRPYNQFTSLIVIVAALALVGGIAIVLVTSRDSLSLAPEIWFGSNTTPTASQVPTATVTPTLEPSPTATATGLPTQAIATLEPQPTQPAATETTASSLPEGVVALAEVSLNGVAARLRDGPGGTVIGALLNGTQVEVLEGRESVQGVIWVEVRDPAEGVTGWVSEDLIQIIDSGEAAGSASPTPGPEDSPTPLPTLAGGVSGLAIVRLDSGVAGRLRDAPGGRVIGGVPDGSQVEVLQGRQVLEGVIWVEIRSDTGQVGWMAESLIDYLPTATPGG